MPLLAGDVLLVGPAQCYEHSVGPFILWSSQFLSSFVDGPVRGLMPVLDGMIRMELDTRNFSQSVVAWKWGVFFAGNIAVYHVRLATLQLHL